MNKHDGFKVGSGCFKCAMCEKLTRRRKDDSGSGMCRICEDISMHENVHADNDFPNDLCDDGDECLVKDYTKDKRWWLK